MIQGKGQAMSDREVSNAGVIKQFVEGSMSRKVAADALGCTERWISILAKRYSKLGSLGVVHGNANRISPRRTSEVLAQVIRELFKEKYINFNYKHFHEMLFEREQIHTSYSNVKRICGPLGLTKKPRRKKKARHYRKRYGAMGIMLQMDGSEHEWTKGKVWTLITGIDDATSEITYGEFFETESMEGYLRVLSMIFEKTGVPLILYVDYAAWLSGTTKSDETGQFKRMCKELGIQIIFANSAQAKGRIERTWGTFQDRLLAELQLEKITERGAATEYLNSVFLPKTWQKKFTVEPRTDRNYYKAPPTAVGLRNIFCLKYDRTVRNDHVINWQNGLYAIKTDLPYSIAKRQVKIHVYLDKTEFKAFYAGRELELEKVVRPGEWTSQTPQRPGLRTELKNQADRKTLLNT